MARLWEEVGLLLPGHEPLVVHALLPMLGVSADKNYAMNSLCNDKTGEDVTINVEYNQLDPLLNLLPPPIFVRRI